jgi:Starch-binding associating with outer membrane/Susd and RagB outer membrane lipoprotein
MKNILKLLSLTMFCWVASCQSLDENLEDPNNVSIGNLDVNLLMNTIQMDFGDFFANATEPTMALTRQTAMTNGDTYERAYKAENLNDLWTIGYQKVLNQIETLLGKTEGTGYVVHTGSAKVMKAYTYMTLVDIFGAVPFSEAAKGLTGNFNPKADDGKTVYTGCLTLLDAALVDLAKTAGSGQGMTRDIYYGGSAAKWTALANTLKLKAWLNLRLTDAATAKTKIEELLTKDLIDTEGENFTYKYGTADVPQRSRHPLYRQMYTPVAGSASGYISNYFMKIAFKDKGVQDPRWRYYFYRQVGSLAKALADEPAAIPCMTTPRPDHYITPYLQAWCAFDPGFFGRDHGNGDGTPPDSKAITAFGVYPAGGLADKNDSLANNFGAVTVQGQGANGGGIEPIMMSSFTDFMKAEAALILGTTGDAKAFTLSAVNKSIATVKAFGAAKGQTPPAALEPSVTDYVTKVTEGYDAAATSADKLNVITKEYMIALFGNGVEGYNLYRRTGGLPKDIQPIRAAVGGSFFRTLIYPAVCVNLNASIKQKPDPKTQVFWDNHPAGLIK